MTRQLLIVVLVAVALSTAIGFALGSAAAPQSADAASTNTQIVSQLKQLNANVRNLNGKIGANQTDQGTVRGLLTIICDYTASIPCK
jgi:flagellar basal body-associated protein FliL